VFGRTNPSAKMTEAVLTRPPLWIWALAVTSVMQVESAFLTSAMTVIGPTLTEVAGVPAERIGHLTAISSFGTMLFLLTGGPLLVRFGPVRLLQLGALLGAAALALAPAGGWWPSFLLASFLAGIAYGPSPPAGSDILQRHAPAGRRSLIFSIKQAAAPLGGALAGLIVPPLATLYGWRVALGVAALLAAAATLAAQPWRAALDAERDPTRRMHLGALLSPAALTAPFRALGLAPILPRLTYLAFSLAVVQGCLLGFYVTYMVAAVGLPLETAGIAFAVLQGTGVVARVCVGWIADRVGSGILILTVLAAGSIATPLVTASMSQAWPFWAILLIAVASGFAATSWNGIYMAEVARMAPEGRIGDATSGSTFLTFIGYVLGPFVFATVVEQTASYRIAFLLAAALPLSAVLLLRAPLRGRRGRKPVPGRPGRKPELGREER
jgi:MFS family permease